MENKIKNTIRRVHLIPVNPSGVSCVKDTLFKVTSSRDSSATAWTLMTAFII